MEKARRYNKGKIRYELISTQGLKDIAEVYTKGAEKYTIYNEDGSIKEDGANNWRKGMSWTDTIASVKRHIADWEVGKDYDELGTKHLANAAWGLITILDYYKSYPQGDDRIHHYLRHPRIGLDIDDVLADFIPAWCLRHNKELPTSWLFDRDILQKFEEMRATGELDDFYLGLEMKTKPEDIPFEPVVYVTARPVASEITAAWLDRHGYPAAPVCTVGVGQSKADCLREHNVDIFIDDSFPNFKALNEAGICTYLFDSCHNQRHEVGHKRLHNLKDLEWSV